MALAERVNVTRRFQRAVRIDLDLDDPGALEGFICPPSSAAVLKTMARHVLPRVAKGHSPGQDLMAAASQAW